MYIDKIMKVPHLAAVVKLQHMMSLEKFDGPATCSRGFLFATHSKVFLSTYIQHRW